MDEMNIMAHPERADRGLLTGKRIGHP